MLSLDSGRVYVAIVLWRPVSNVFLLKPLRKRKFTISGSSISPIALSEGKSPMTLRGRAALWAVATENGALERRG